MKSRILNFVDFERANALLEDFNKATGFVTAILDLDGNILSKSGWRKICTDFHRVNDGTAFSCKISDTELASKLGEGKKYHFYKCINGLIDVAVPIVIRGEHIANLFSGQFFFEEPDVSFFKKQAQTYGFNEQLYLEALSKVPVVSHEKVELVMGFLLNITQTIIEMTADRLDQIGLIEELNKRESALMESQMQLEQTANDLLESQRIAHVGTWRLDLSTNQVKWSEELYKMYGFDPSLPPPPYTEHMKLFTSESWNILSTALEQTRTTGTPVVLLVLFRKQRQKVSLNEHSVVQDYVPTILLVGMIALLIFASFLKNKPSITNGLICIGVLLIGLIRQMIRTKAFYPPLIRITKEIDWTTWIVSLLQRLYRKRINRPHG